MIKEKIMVDLIVGGDGGLGGTSAFAHDHRANRMTNGRRDKGVKLLILLCVPEEGRSRGRGGGGILGGDPNTLSSIVLAC